MKPHPLPSSADEEVARTILGERTTARPTPEETPLRCDAMGIAHGNYTRSYPSTPEDVATYDPDGDGVADPAFQEEALAQVGSYAQMAGDVAAMGVGRIRRNQQCDGLWACLFPYKEYVGSMHNWARMLLPPGEIYTEIAADAFGRLSSTTALLGVLLRHGVKMDLEVFNAAGGMRQNWTPKSATNKRANVPYDDFGTTTVPWASVAAAAPAWQKGYLVCSGEGWDPSYYNFLGAGDQVAQQFIVNVWPTQDDGFTELPRCRRYKALAVAAFSTGIGDWLAAIDTAMRSLGIGEVYDLVDTISVGNELDQFFYFSEQYGVGLQEIDDGEREAGAYVALLAGPIRHAVPRIHFRTEVASWGQGTGQDDLDAKLAWLYNVLNVGMRTEVDRWREIAAWRLLRDRGGWWPSPPADVADWFTAEADCGFEWPPGSALRIGVGELMQQVGVHFYHGYNRSEGGVPAWELYADSAAAGRDIARFETTFFGLPDFSLGFVIGEIAFPAVDPLDPDFHDPTLEWAPTYQNTSETLQAAMHVRLLLTFLAARVEVADIYTFNYASATCGAAGSGSSCFAAWGDFNSQGVHNDIYEEGSGTGAYSQSLDCWPRAAWYSFRRLTWLLAHLGANPGASMELVANASGVTVVELRFPTGITRGPGGEELLIVSDVEPPDVELPRTAIAFARAYVMWVDQYTALTSAVTVTFDVPEGVENDEYVVLSLVPTTTVDQGSTGVNGYASASPSWQWEGWRSALASVTANKPEVDGGPWSPEAAAWEVAMEVLQCAPVTGTALAPVCILTNSTFRSVS